MLALQVMLPVIGRSAALPRSTKLVEPLKESALPYLPVAVQVAPLSVPVCPLPVASAVVVPAPSLKPYAARRADGAAGVPALAPLAEALGVPAASGAPTRYLDREPTPGASSLGGVPH